VKLGSGEKEREKTQTHLRIVVFLVRMSTYMRTFGSCMFQPIAVTYKFYFEVTIVNY